MNHLSIDNRCFMRLRNLCLIDSYALFNVICALPQTDAFPSIGMTVGVAHGSFVPILREPSPPEMR